MQLKSTSEKLMKEQTIEEIRVERDLIAKFAKEAQERELELAKAIDILILAGFVTREKVEQARAVVSK